VEDKIASQAALPESNRLQPGNHRHRGIRGLVGRAENSSPRLLGLESEVGSGAE